MPPPPSGEPTAAPRWRPLDARQRRVLGVLIEKAKTTPAAYPLTVNAIVTGCNQKSNRDPLTDYDDIAVEQALDQLRTLGVVTEVDWVGRVSKYKHHAYEWMGVNRAELAVLAELLLRGAQTLGDLRARAARMEPIADLAALKPIVDGLVARGLMFEVTPPGRGQVVSHDLYPPDERGEVARLARGAAARAAEHETATAVPRATAGPNETRSSPGTSALADEIAALRTELHELRARVEALEDRRG